VVDGQHLCRALSDAYQKGRVPATPRYVARFIQSGPGAVDIIQASSFFLVIIPGTGALHALPTNSVTMALGQIIHLKQVYLPQEAFPRH
jgi:hypothetical protein